MKDFTTVAIDSDLVNFINSNLFDPWVGTPFQGYRYLDNKQKGNYGEVFTSKLLESQGLTVEKAKKSNDEYDRKVGDYKVEIKFSLSHTDHKNQTTKEDEFTMNHVALKKGWDRLIFVGVNYDTDKSISKFMEKDDFEELIQNGDLFNTYFSRQQGGKNGDNDDYISAGKKLKNLINSEYMKDLSEW